MNVAIITARGGSKGLPRKNILSLNGIPLIGWTIKAALESKSIDQVYVTTEDEEIARISRKLGASVIDRPVELAQDTTPSEPVLEHAIKWLRSENFVVENVFLLQPTSPMRNSKHIDAAWRLFSENEADCVISVFEPRHSPAKAYKINDDGSISGLLHEGAPYMRRQDLATCVQPNGAVYLFHADKFLAKNQIPRSNVFPMMMSEQESIDIDTLEDLEAAASLLEKTNETRV